MTGTERFYAHIDSADVDDQHPEGTVSIFGPAGTDERVIGHVAGPTLLADAVRLIESVGWATVGNWDGIDTGMVIDVVRPISAEEMDRRASFGPPVR